MTANLRYLNASFFSFCFHALIFLYIYGTFDTNNSQSLLISKPLMVQLRFESEIQAAQKKIRPVNKPPDTQSFQQQERKTNSSESTESVFPVIEESMLYSNLADLLEQEESVILSEQDEKIFFYSQKIIQTIEDAWMKPRNIPEGLVANLRLNIQPTGRISRVDLLKSSGNIRFDNSALQAVRRVETLNFFNEIPSGLYKKEFTKIAVSFKPS